MVRVFPYHHLHFLTIFNSFLFFFFQSVESCITMIPHMNLTHSASNVIICDVSLILHISYGYDLKLCRSCVCTLVSKNNSLFYVTDSVCDSH